MERPPEEPARPDGRHPARTRRKRKRRRALQPKNVWQTDTHWNPFNPAVALGSSVLFAAAVFVSVLVPALKEAPSWLMTTVMLSLLAALLTTPWYTATFLHWRVAEELILALQPGRGATMTRSFDNRDFKALSEHGPFAIIRCTSGKRLVWPRWLVHKWVVYRWHLDGNRLSLQASGVAQSGTNTSQGNVA
jgi:hypothetical protein